MSGRELRNRIGLFNEVLRIDVGLNEGTQQGARGRYSETIRIARFGHKKTLDSQGKTLKNQGFGEMRAERLELSTQGLKVLCSTD